MYMFVVFLSLTNIFKYILYIHKIKIRIILRKSKNRELSKQNILYLYLKHLTKWRFLNKILGEEFKILGDCIIT